MNSIFIGNILYPRRIQLLSSIHDSSKNEEKAVIDGNFDGNIMTLSR